MELSAPLLQLLAGLGIGPVWLVPLTGLIILLVQKYFPGLKLPVAPTPEPVKPTPINPNPVLPVLPERPTLLSLILQILSLKANGGVKVEENALVELLAKEVTSLKQYEIK